MLSYILLYYKQRNVFASLHSQIEHVGLQGLKVLNIISKMHILYNKIRQQILNTINNRNETKTNQKLNNSAMNWDKTIYKTAIFVQR